MQKLFLIRHGESAAAGAGSSDFQRILTLNGKSAIAALGNSLASQVISPVHIHCSAAKRTTETAEILASRLCGIIYANHGFYNGGLHDYLELLRNIGLQKQVILVGHNPVVTELHYHLTGNWSVFMPGTCTILTAPQDSAADSISFNAGSMQQHALIHPA